MSIVVRLIEHSIPFKELFQEHITALENAIVFAQRARTLGFAAHRFGLTTRICATPTSLTTRICATPTSSSMDCGTSMEARAAALKACRAAIDAGVDETIKGSVEAVFLGMQWQTGNCASKLVDDQAVCTHC